MTSTYRYKMQLSDKIYKILSEKYNYPNDEESVTATIKSWWHNTLSSSNSMHLTTNGISAFINADIENYKINIFSEDNNLILNPHIIKPLIYYVDKTIKVPHGYNFLDKTMILFDSKMYMTINLYGTIQDYLRVKNITFK